MSPLVLILLSAILVNSAELPSSEPKETAREEKLRSALIDAFQNIKKASAKGGLDDDTHLNSDLIGSLTPKLEPKYEKPTTDFDLFSDDDGLTFAEAFDNVEPERKASTTENSHNVQHIVKTTKIPLNSHKTTARPNKDGILNRLSDSIDSIRTTLNESRLSQKKEIVNTENVLDNAGNTTEVLGIENMLRVFDADILVTQWDQLQEVVHGACKEDMAEYVSGLKEKQLWALKSKCFIFSATLQPNNLYCFFMTVSI
ncbi:hypothetical protein O0L34_g12813 [Tuta absoluta]|nr:hypothetical protein O0L34_g12813 [Tuta absoluta]